MKKFISISFFTWLFVMFSYPLFVEAAMPERKQLFDTIGVLNSAIHPMPLHLHITMSVGEAWICLMTGVLKPILMRRFLPETMVAICLRVLDGTERSST